MHSGSGRESSKRRQVQPQLEEAFDLIEPHDTGLAHVSYLNTTAATNARDSRPPIILVVSQVSPLPACPPTRPPGP